MAVAAASHFGNTTPASNRNAQYVVVSPHGTKPDGFNTPTGGFCAWHDWNGDPTDLSGGPVTSTVGDMAFTNLPYLTDAGTSCGQNFVNSGSGGTLDGVTIVEGHEYAETITDQNPPGGWLDSQNPAQENADKCAWISSGQGASANVAFANGTFAMQSTWANDFNSGAGGCMISHSDRRQRHRRGHGHQPGQPDRHGRHRDQPDPARQRRQRDVLVERDRPAGRTVAQRLLRGRQRHADHRRDVDA